MRNQTLDQILQDAKPAIAAHWAVCLDAGLAGCTPAAIANLDKLIARYFENLKALPEPATKAALLGEMAALFEGLDKANAGADGALLETDERELLVPLIIEAAAASGLDIAEFPDGDPTLEFRNF